MLPSLLSAAIGVWLIAAPGVLDYGGAAAANERIVGPVVASLAVIAAAEAVRGLRWANAVCGLWLLVTPLLLLHGGTPLLVELSAGAALLVLAPLGGRVQGRYGGGWRAVLRGPANTA